MSLDNKLTILDFTKSVRSSEINHNFSVVKGWIERERLRIGGWGIVEGFGLSYPDNDFCIHIDEGILINENGEEQLVDAGVLSCGEPEYETLTEDILIDENGRIELKYTPYSPKNLGIIYYAPPEVLTKPDTSELTIIDTTDMMTKIPVLNVMGNIITVSPRDWAGKTAHITYRHCDDRIDAILLDKDGNFHRQAGILSTNPSKTDIDLTDMYIIGFAHWIIDRSITVEFIVDGRTYRKVYVNPSNVLYLNGKKYTDPKWILFEEPETPEEKDVLYDIDSNTLMIYLNGEWIIMNDFTVSRVRSLKMWQEKDNPADLQTFLFDDSELNLRYVPDQHNLEIVIDQQVLMEDQYTEVILPGTKPYLSSGIGFKLNEPLDRATVVQCIVNHNVQNAPLQNVFQRASIFIDENYSIYSSSLNPGQIFRTSLSYVTNENQLEVFVNGARLDKNVDFAELEDDGITQVSSGVDSVTQFFKVISPLRDGDKVTYKISRYVWSYDQLNQMVEDIENTANLAKATADNNTLQINNINTNIANYVTNLQNQIDAITKTLSTLSNYRLKTDKITIDDIDSKIRDKLLNNFETVSFNAGLPSTSDDNKINDVTSSDLVFVSYLNNNTCVKLIEGASADYIISYDSSDRSAHIVLRSDLITTDATVIADVIRFGV